MDNEDVSSVDLNGGSLKHGEHVAETEQSTKPSNVEENENGTSTKHELPDFKACFPGVAMSASPESTLRPMKWGLWCTNDRQWMELCRGNYEVYHRQRNPHACDGPYRIPRIIHQIWLGSPLPEAFARLQQSWNTKHEGWELRLWTEADAETFGLENKAAFDAAGNYGQKSDIFRYEILLREGGLYVDLDFICLGSFEDLHKRYDFYAGVSNTGTFELNNGLIGCRAGHPILRDVVRRIRKSCTPQGRHRPDDVSSRNVIENRSAEGKACTPVSVAAGSMSAQESALAISAAGAGGIRGEETEQGVGVASLASLMGGLGGLGSCGLGQDTPGGLLAGLLGNNDQARLTEAVGVEKGSATETIAKTGPGVFTIAAMVWLSSKFSRDAAVAPAIDGTPAIESTPSSPADQDSGNVAGATMIFPPSYFYPVPNNIKGDVIGDGRESEVHAGGAGRFFRTESLAAHLWARSWQ